VLREGASRYGLAWLLDIKPCKARPCAFLVVGSLPGMRLCLRVFLCGVCREWCSSERVYWQSLAGYY
jgi:hypothetical protein